MTEYIIEWSGIGARIVDLIGSVPTCLITKRIREERLREEIVRCRDCEYFAYADLEHDNNDWCAKHEHIAWSVNGFCAWGERKESVMKPSKYWNDNRTEREFEECGLQCCTRTNDLGHRCGYVALPKGHPLFGKSWDACYEVAPELQVDGGITFWSIAARCTTNGAARSAATCSWSRDATRDTTTRTRTFARHAGARW